MAAPAPHTPSSTASPPHANTHWWILALTAAIALIVWDTVQNARHYAEASANYGVAVRAPAVDPGSPTGYADGRRNIVYPARWVDAQHWIMQTQQMLATGDWRLRHVDDDNAPFGRDVHWGSPFRWWLALWAFVDHAFSDAPLGVAVERGAILANPVLLILLLVVLVPWIARRFGDLAATLLALAMVATPPFYVLFAPDNMDHHGLIEACLMISFVALLSGGGGWTRDHSVPTPTPWHHLPTPLQARRAFAIAGVAGGFGLWVSAASMIPVFAAFAAAALATAWLGRDAPAFAQHEATLWRRWAVAGSTTAFVCYLLEYFPSHLGWRLEVNHPLYALAWLGAGELLTAATVWLNTRRRPCGLSTWLRLAAALIALAAPAIVIAIGGARVFVVSDPFLWALSNDYTPEFRSLASALNRAGLDSTTIVSCLPVVFALAAFLWMFRRTTPPLARALLGFPLAATAFFWVMAWKELRWWSVSFGFLFGVALVLACLVTTSALTRARRAACWIAGLALLVTGLVLAARSFSTERALTRDDFLSLAERDLAHALRLRAGTGPLVVLSSPATTSRLLYFGSARGLGTAYWENLDGMKRAAAIFAAKNAEDAHALVRAAGITHIILLSWDDFIAPYIRLARGLSAAEPITEPAFGLDLVKSGTPPPWLRRLPDHLPNLPLFQNEQVLIYEVTDRDEPEQVLVRTARDLLYRGQLSAARELIPDLERHPDNLAAQVALARIDVATRDSDGFAAALDRAVQQLGRRASLEPEDRVDLIAVLTLGNRLDVARTELEEALGEFDETAIRHLTPGSLANLLALAGRFEAAWPNPHLQELANELLPPDRRL